jgi:hypothetical protein
MAIKEVATLQEIYYAIENQDPGNATITGATFDTADYDNGIYFAGFITDWTAGEAVMTIYEDDAVGMGTETIVGAANLIYTAPTLGTAATVEGASIAKLGCFGTKRYLRAKLTGNVACNLDAVVLAIKNPEIAPTGQGGLA